MKKTVLTIILAAILLGGCNAVAAPNAAVQSAGKASASPRSTVSLGVPGRSPSPSPEATQTAEDQEADDDMEVVEIKEKMFIAQCNDVYLNPSEYENKKIKLEGMYDEYTDSVSSNTYRYIYRRGPGCCGNDGVAGFEILYDGPGPQVDDWIQLTGTVEVIEEDGSETVVLRVKELDVKQERGAEFVSS